MTRNPILNALAALAYIALVASVMFYGGRVVAGPDKSPLGPIVILSLFTFSAAAMAYIFFYQPFELYFGGKKKEAIKLAFQSIGYFGGITILLLLLFFSGAIK